MELKDTVDGMLSTDYKERFISEYNQLIIRYRKLKKFNERIEVADLSDGQYPMPKHDCPIELLKAQEELMKDLLRILEKRAIIENIDLED